MMKTRFKTSFGKHDYFNALLLGLDHRFLIDLEVLKNTVAWIKTNVRVDEDE